MEQQEIQHFVEAALLAAARPLGVDQLQALFDGRSTPEKSEIRQALDTLNKEYEKRGIEIAEVASGFRLQIKSSMADRLQKLWEDRPPRYSRALFETLALVAYRQPITRGEIEEIRGVAVSSNIVRTLLERDWIRVVGHRDVPGRPAMFGTTKGFLDYFGLKKLDDLPELADLSDWESLRIQLDLPDVDAAYSDPERPEEEFAVPVLLPDGADNGTLDDVAEVSPPVTAAASPAEDIPELQPIEDQEPAAPKVAEDEELVVSEWPDPAESSRG
jgi:segregation and condensation protein B